MEDDELLALLEEDMEDGGVEEGGHKRRLDLASRADAARSLAGACRQRAGLEATAGFPASYHPALAADSACPCCPSPLALQTRPAAA